MKKRFLKLAMLSCCSLLLASCDSEIINLPSDKDDPIVTIDKDDNNEVTDNTKEDIYNSIESSIDKNEVQLNNILYDLAKEQMKGFSGLMGFVINSDNLDDIKKFFNSLKCFRIGVSWGGHESLIYAPAISYLKEMPKEQFDAMVISLGVMRISVGLEDYNDLIADLDEALKNIK